MKEKDDKFHERRWIGCPIEEEYLGEERKQGKKDRKMAIDKDRSKYKKTDQLKYQKSLEKDKELKLGKQDWLEGRVLSIMPQGVIVDYENQLYSCVLKGLLKKDKTQAKNLVAVGDFVLFEKTGEKEGIIAHIKPRQTILSRADNLSRRKEQLIAVNIDQVIITVSVVNPPLKFPIIDRYIIATKKGGMSPLIVVNKVDLLEQEGEDGAVFEQERNILEEAKAAYASAGVSLICVSTMDGTGIDALKLAMKDRTSVFSGQSGVGKSSLINVTSGFDLRVGEIVERTNKGSHTTTTTNLLPLPFGGWCVDTPGIKSFGVWDLKREEIDGFFPDIQVFGVRCEFSDCTHTHEEHCAVHEALEEGKLSLLRYESYQALRLSMGDEHVRR